MSGAPTPRPWRSGTFICDGVARSAVVCSAAFAKHGASTIPIAVCEDALPGDGDVNAALIVRCVNSHDALVAACESAANDLEFIAKTMHGEKDPEYAPSGIMTNVANLRAAIDIAKGEAS